MTDKEKILAKIESLLNEINYEPYTDETFGRIQSLKELKSYIDSLPEEPVSEDLEEKAKRYAIEQVLCTTDTIMCEQAYLSLRIFNGYDVACAYKDGAESHREQMMKEAIDARIEEYVSADGQYIDCDVSDKGFKKGDKVKLIIIKED